MKKTRLLLSIGMLAFAGLTTTMVSCSNDDEPCPVGYEGEDCETLSRTKFLGNWNGEDKCDSDTYSDITLGIDESASSKIKAVVSNPGGFGGSVTITGEMTSENTLTFTNQSVGGGRTLNGKMVISGTSDMSFTYDVVNTSGEEDGCIGTYEKL